MKAACSYHHLVDRAGCNAYLNTQKKACLCPQVLTRILRDDDVYGEAESLHKFGWDAHLRREKRIGLCSPPFVPYCPPKGAAALKEQSET